MSRLNTFYINYNNKKVDILFKNTNIYIRILAVYKVRKQAKFSLTWNYCNEICIIMCQNRIGCLLNKIQVKNYHKEILYRNMSKICENKYKCVTMSMFY